jgi:hypothetical protein
VRSLLRPDGAHDLTEVSPGGVQRLSGQSAVERLVSQPVYGDLRYAGRTLVRSAGLRSADGYTTVTSRTMAARCATTSSRSRNTGGVLPDQHAITS